MKSYFWLGLLGLVGCMLAADTTLAQAKKREPATKLAPSMGWQPDLATARAVAQKTGKPLMVVFRCDP